MRCVKLKQCRISRNLLACVELGFSIWMLKSPKKSGFGLRVVRDGSNQRGGTGEFVFNIFKRGDSWDGELGDFNVISMNCCNNATTSYWAGFVDGGVSYGCCLFECKVVQWFVSCFS